MSVQHIYPTLKCYTIHHTYYWFKAFLLYKYKITKTSNATSQILLQNCDTILIHKEPYIVPKYCNAARYLKWSLIYLLCILHHIFHAPVLNICKFCMKNMMQIAEMQRRLNSREFELKSFRQKKKCWFFVQFRY